MYYDGTFQRSGKNSQQLKAVSIFFRKKVIGPLTL